eukprot:PhF_6_TR43329/c0_g1_i2/m.66244
MTWRGIGMDVLGSVVTFSTLGIPLSIPSARSILEYLESEVFQVKTIDRATGTYGVILDMSQFPLTATSETRHYTGRFRLGTAEWRLLFLRTSTQTSIGVFVECMSVTEGPIGFTARTNFRFVCVNQKDRSRDLSNRDKFTFVYDNRGEKDRGFHGFLNIATMIDPDNGYCFAHPHFGDSCVEVHLCLRDWSLLDTGGDIGPQNGWCPLTAYPFSLHVPWLTTLYHLPGVRDFICGSSFNTTDRPFLQLLQSLFRTMSTTVNQMNCDTITTLLGWDKFGTSYGVRELLQILFDRIGSLPFTFSIRTIPMTAGSIEPTLRGSTAVDLLIVD